MVKITKKFKNLSKKSEKMTFSTKMDNQKLYNAKIIFVLLKNMSKFWVQFFLNCGIK